MQEQVEKLVRNLVPDDAPIYGMVIHEASDLNPSTRVEYLGANKDFTPMSMNMSTHAMNYGSWADWDWLKANVPVMCNWDGGIDYFLDPDDYTKKADGTNSDAANIDYAGDAMAIVKKAPEEEKQAAFKWLTYLNTVGTKEFSMKTGYVPVRSSVKEDEEYKAIS